MKTKLILLLITLSLTSCATFYNKKTYDLPVFANCNTKLKIYDTIYELPAKVKVIRSKKVLNFTLISDTIKKVYTVEPALNSEYLYYNILFYPGYLIDLTNQKRFYYGKSLFLNANDTIKKIVTPDLISWKNTKHFFTKELKTSKGNLNFTFSIPLVNDFYFQPTNEPISKSKGFGFTSGLEYFYKSKKFVALKASAFTDGVKMEGAYYDEKVYHYNDFRSFSIALTDNYKLNRITLGYGLFYSRNLWYSTSGINDAENSTINWINKTNNTLGLATNGYYQVCKSFFVGCNYNASLLKVNEVTKFQYEHVFAIDFQWKISLNKH